MTDWRARSLVFVAPQNDSTRVTDLKDLLRTISASCSRRRSSCQHRRACIPLHGNHQEFSCISQRFHPYCYSSSLLAGEFVRYKLSQHIHSIMIRSQSISSFGDKRKTGLLMSLRSRKSSTQDLNSLISKPKPLTQSTETLANITASTNTNVMTSKRHSVLLLSPTSGENKENTETHKVKESRRSLKIFRSRPSPSPSSEKTLASIGLEPSDTISMETLSLDPLSPLSPIKMEACEFSPNGLQEFSYIHNFEEEPASNPAKLHRTVNLADMREFVKKLDEQIVPIGNRQSLDFEAREFQVFQDKLKDHRDDLSIYLVENAMCMSFFQQRADEAMERLSRYWDEIDVEETLKLESYHLDENIYLHL